MRGKSASVREQLSSTSSRVAFVYDHGDRFAVHGALFADNPRIRDVGDCELSCADWYGNSRPIFLGERILALMGGELVEGTVEKGALTSSRRLRFIERRPSRGP